MSYNAKVYNKQGGDELVVEDGGKITAAGTQAATIASYTTTVGLDADDVPVMADKLNAIIAALEGVGILAKA